MSKDDEKDNEPQIKPAFAREAAVVALGKLLETKKRGERITAAEIQEATGFANWASFRSRIKTWARRNKLVAVGVPNDGWRFATAAEYADHSDRNRRSALKRDKESLRILIDVPVTELDDVQVRRRDFMLIRAATRVTSGESQDREIRSELKLTERVPMRSTSSKPPL